MTAKSEEVYIVSNKMVQGGHHSIMGACSTFKKAKKLAFKGWNGEIKIAKSVEEYIDKANLMYAFYLMDLTNINGVSSYIIEIKKMIIDERV